MFTTCSTAKVDYVRKHLDVDAVIDYRKEDVTERIGELTDGLGVDLVVDTVSGAEAEKDFDDWPTTVSSSPLWACRTSTVTTCSAVD